MGNLIGLPEHGVVLSGDMNAPIIINRSTRRILGYTLRFEDDDGHFLNRIKLSLLALRNGVANPGIAPAAQATFSSNAEVRIPGMRGTFSKVTLDAVLFEDGEMVGPDRSRTFENVTAHVNAQRDLHRKLLATQNKSSSERVPTWSHIADIARGQSANPLEPGVDPSYLQAQRTFAEELTDVRASQGEDAAYRLSGKTAVYPTIWRKR